MSGYRRRKNNNLLALAFVLGVVCCLILPLWTWLLAVGLLLIAAGCRILVDWLLFGRCRYENFCNKTAKVFKNPSEKNIPSKDRRIVKWENKKRAERVLLCTFLNAIPTLPPFRNEDTWYRRRFFWGCHPPKLLLFLCSGSSAYWNACWNGWPCCPSGALYCKHSKRLPLKHLLL